MVLSEAQAFKILSKKTLYMSICKTGNYNQIGDVNNLHNNFNTQLV